MKICPFMSSDYDVSGMIRCKEEECMAWIPAKLKIASANAPTMNYQPGYCKLIGEI